MRANIRWQGDIRDEFELCCEETQIGIFGDKRAMEMIINFFLHRMRETKCESWMIPRNEQTIVDVIAFPSMFSWKIKNVGPSVCWLPDYHDKRTITSSRRDAVNRVNSFIAQPSFLFLALRVHRAKKGRWNFFFRAVRHLSAWPFD